ncbi:ankyrin repeat domain-containing protein 39 [Ambystoma mexicanum]|uniref:ankyrin repeat domain-containing protein 39 n=1 Tax=Ambystoma mexicanum TaxID=8296 RepID=UPI0037E93D1E
MNAIRDSGKLCILLLLDISAAFDLVDHEKQCTSLAKDFNFSNDATLWVKSFLAVRTSRVTIGKEAADPIPVPIGVPQGSCLSPTLFNAYTKLLFSALDDISGIYTNFADDTQILMPISVDVISKSPGSTDQRYEQKRPPPTAGEQRRFYGRAKGALAQDPYFGGGPTKLPDMKKASCWFPMASHSCRHIEGAPCCAHVSSAAPRSVHQTLEEMDFERGIWSAAMDGDLGRVKKFIELGTDPSLPDKSGYTALHYASRQGHLSICELLLTSGAHCNAQTHGGATPLHRASYCGHNEVAQLLLSHGAKPETVDDDGMTCLHKAAEKGHADLCDLLVQHSPVLKTIQDRKSRRASDLVSTNSQLKMFLET